MEELLEKTRVLPKGWRSVHLGDVLSDIIGGGTPSRGVDHYWNGDIPWITVKDMRTRRPEAIQEHITEAGVNECATNIIPADTVITATRVGLGKVVRVPYPAAINQDLKALIVGPDLEKDYLEWWIISQANYIESIGSGTTVKGIRLNQLKELEIPLAPLPQQRRIVEAIELQLGRLDAAVARLQGAKARLKRYKQAVLKAAVEGGDWDTVPLRELIQEGRKIAYGVLKPGPHVVDGVRFIKSGQVRDGEMDLTEDYRISKALDQEFHRTRLQGGEVLLNLVGASIGRSAVAPDELKGANVTRAIAVIPVLREKARWVQLVLNTPYGQEHMLGKTGGNAQPVLNLAVVKDIPIPLPAEKEMEEVVTRTREQLFATSEMEATLDAQLQQAVRLRQAVLKRAFEGRLG